jgi:hypothetical protein
MLFYLQSTSTDVLVQRTRVDPKTLKDAYCFLRFQVQLFLTEFGRLYFTRSSSRKRGAGRVQKDSDLWKVIQLVAECWTFVGAVSMHVAKESRDREASQQEFSIGHWHSVKATQRATNVTYNVIQFLKTAHSEH